MDYKTWVFVVLGALILINYVTGAYIDSNVQAALSKADVQSATASTTCLIALYLTLPKWYVPNTEDILIALFITWGLLYFVKKKKLPLWKKAVLFGGVWAALKLTMLWIVESNPDCSKLFSESSGLMGGTLGIMLSLFFLVMTAKWLLGRRQK